MNTKIVAGVVAGLIVVAGGAFYGGMMYQKSMGPVRGAGNFTFTNRPGAGGIRTGGITAGSILSKDATSITLKLSDGSTKIVLTNASTSVMKTTEGSVSDLSIGANVTVIGSTNSDGSITAQSLQLRPAGMLGFKEFGGREQVIGQ